MVQQSQRVDLHRATDAVKGFECIYRPKVKNVPPIFEAAIPVLAVTETTPGFFICFFLSAAMIARRSSDFPVPGQQKHQDQ